jgi:hypothetical protein
MGGIHRVGLAALPLAAALVGAFGGSASAAAAPSVFMSCEGLSNSTYCEIVANEVQVTSINWKVGGVGRPDLANKRIARIGLDCAGKRFIRIEAEVKDASGATYRPGSTHICGRNPV